MHDKLHPPEIDSIAIKQNNSLRLVGIDITYEVKSARKLVRMYIIASTLVK